MVKPAFNGKNIERTFYFTIIREREVNFCFDFHNIFKAIIYKNINFKVLKKTPDL